jgi:predicted dehydrogenase
MEAENKFSGKTLLILGCGSRGENYASYAKLYPDKARVVGIADPRKFARNQFLSLYDTIDKNKVFLDWRSIIDTPEKLADCVVIALPDKDHKEASIACTNKG